MTALKTGLNTNAAHQRLAKHTATIVSLSHGKELCGRQDSWEEHSLWNIALSILKASNEIEKSKAVDREDGWV